MFYWDSVNSLIDDAKRKILTGKKDDVLNELVKRHVQLKAVLTFYHQAQNTHTKPEMLSGDKSTSDFVAGEDVSKSTEIVAIVPDKASVKDTLLNPESLEYKLAVTDLFVETALNKLEKKAKSYQWQGKAMYFVSLIIIIVGVFASLTQLMPFSFPMLGIKSTPEAHPTTLIDLAAGFTRAFTFYGFIMICAVALWRFGRAMFDQSERLFGRVHALRQGRLYVHLAKGEISIDDMEKAFAWNQTQANAFENLATDGKAPWGAILGELIKTAPALVQTGTNMANANAKANANANTNANANANTSANH